jgi:hypothetical protein
MKTRTLLWTLLLAGICAVSSTAMAAEVWTDRPDYAPGEIALIGGAGFFPNEPMTLSISIDDPETGLHIGDWDWTDGYADMYGGFETSYTVPDEAEGMTLTATAMGYTSGLVAAVTFTDAAAVNISFATSGLPAGTSITIALSGTNNGGNPQNVNVTFSSPGPSADTGLKAGTTFTYSGFPTSVAGVGEHWELTGTSPASGSLTGEAGSNITVTGSYTHVVDVVNHAPVITPAEDLTVNLGQWVGCLGASGFSRTFAVSYTVVAGTGNSKIVKATFTRPDSSTVTVSVANVTDADAGDTITVNLANGTNPVTISGPGGGSASFSVDVTASDGKVTVGPTTCGGTAEAQIIYAFVGFLRPLDNAVTTIVKRGSTVPVKFQIFDCSGNAITTGDHTIDVTCQIASVPYGDPTVDDAGKSGDDGDSFRYEAPNWIFNLKTNTTYAVGVTYQIWADLDDGTTHTVLISIK